MTSLLLLMVISANLLLVCYIPQKLSSRNLISRTQHSPQVLHLFGYSLLVSFLHLSFFLSLSPIPKAGRPQNSALLPPLVLSTFTPWHSSLNSWLYFFFSFFFNFIFKLYIIVLVLPNIKMNPPQVYMCSPS